MGATEKKPVNWHLKAGEGSPAAQLRGQRDQLQALKGREREGLRKAGPCLVQLAVKGGDGGWLGPECFSAPMLAAIKTTEAQGWPDPYQRGRCRGGSKARASGHHLPRKPLFQDQAPNPQVLPDIPNHRLQQGSEYGC